MTGSKIFLPSRPMAYQKHPALIKQLVCTKQLHAHDLKAIPPSTRTYWKKQFKENENVFDTQGTFHKALCNHHTAIRLLLDTLPPQKKKKTFWKKHLHLLTAVVDNCPTPQDKIQILQLLQISAQAYAKWTATPYCQFSLVNLCVKKYPSQLTEAEKTVIKDYMNNPEHAFLNRSQVFWIMRNNKALLITLKTFHKYCNQMGLYSHRPKKTGKQKTIGITADYFLHKVHMDITYVGLLNGDTAFVLNIVDNYTRQLLVSKASLVCDSAFVSSVLKPIIDTYDLNKHHTIIITDGGAENFGEVTTLLQQYENITHKVAKKDIKQSNNIAEACHKRFKNNILPHNYFRDIHHLNEKLPLYTIQYNNLPQHHLQGMTPNNAANGIVFDKVAYQKDSAIALQQRKNSNRNLPCCKELLKVA